MCFFSLVALILKSMDMKQYQLKCSIPTLICNWLVTRNLMIPRRKIKLSSCEKYLLFKYPSRKQIHQELPNVNKGILVTQTLQMFEALLRLQWYILVIKYVYIIFWYPFYRHIRPTYLLWYNASTYFIYLYKLKYKKNLNVGWNEWHFLRNTMSLCWRKSFFSKFPMNQ